LPSWVIKELSEKSKVFPIQRDGLHQLQVSSQTILLTTPLSTLIIAIIKGKVIPIWNWDVSIAEFDIICDGYILSIPIVVEVVEKDDIFSSKDCKYLWFEDDMLSVGTFVAIIDGIDEVSTNGLVEGLLLKLSVDEDVGEVGVRLLFGMVL